MQLSRTSKDRTTTPIDNRRRALQRGSKVAHSTCGSICVPADCNLQPLHERPQKQKTPQALKPISHGREPAATLPRPAIARCAFSAVTPNWRKIRSLCSGATCPNFAGVLAALAACGPRQAGVSRRGVTGSGGRVRVLPSKSSAFTTMKPRVPDKTTHHDWNRRLFPLLCKSTREGSGSAVLFLLCFWLNLF